jgi:hypothetical protein
MDLATLITQIPFSKFSEKKFTLQKQRRFFHVIFILEKQKIKKSEMQPNRLNKKFLVKKQIFWSIVKAIN